MTTRRCTVTTDEMMDGSLEFFIARSARFLAQMGALREQYMRLLEQKRTAMVVTVEKCMDRSDENGLPQEKLANLLATVQSADLRDEECVASLRKMTEEIAGALDNGEGGDGGVDFPLP
jgi:hypothetical protein